MKTRFIKGFLFGLAIVMVLMACGCTAASATVVGEIEQILLGIIPIASAAASVLLPGEASAITAGATLAANAVNTVKTLVAGYHANPSDTTLAKVTAAMTDAQTNLAQLLASAQVKDPTTAAKLTAVVNAATSSLAAVEASINAAHPVTVAAAQSAQGS